MRRYGAIGSTIALLLTLGDPALASARESSPTARISKYVAVGASETRGVGLNSHEAYPYLVQRPCHVYLTVVAEAGRPALLERLPRLESTDLVTVFVGVNDIAAFGSQLTRHDVAEFLRSLSAAGRIIVLLMPSVTKLPGLLSLPGAYRDRQQELYKLIRTSAVGQRFSVVPIAPGPSVTDTLLEPDGIHPNQKGQGFIARLIIDRLLRAPASRAACLRRAIE